MSHGIIEQYDAVAIYGHTAWHGLEDCIPLPTDGVARSIEVLAHRAKLLGWQLARESIYDAQGTAIPGFKATVRKDHDVVLGVHGERYTFFPNEALRDFAEAIRGDALPNSAGSLFGGRLVFICLDMGDIEVLGRTVHQYLVVVNRHDAEAKLRSVVTPVEAVCANTVASGMALATRSWSSRHSASVVERARQASLTLQLNNAYYQAYKAKAEELAAIKTTMPQVQLIIENLFPFDAKLKKLGEKRVVLKREAVLDALQSPDLADIRWTQWGLVQAVADYESHYRPTGSRQNFAQRRFAALIGTESTLVDRTVALMEAL